MFTAAKWDPDAWADLFKKAGAKYVFAPGEHHDGFSNWDSKVNPFNAKNYGPKRDLDGDLIAAVRKVGLKTGISDHSFFHFQFIPTPPPGSDLLNSDLYDPKWKDFYTVADRSNQARVKFMHNWVARRIETIDKYNPDMLWFDMNTDHATDALKIRVAAYYYNRAREWGKEVAISAKQAAWVTGQIMDYEREGRAPMELTDWVWQPDDPIQDKFGYVEGIHPGPPSGYVVRIVENVCKNGNYLLNISPKADGTIPQEQQDVLLAIGKWLGVNGEAIYSTRPWTKFGEGPVADACAASMVKLRASRKFCRTPQRTKHERRRSRRRRRFAEWIFAQGHPLHHARRHALRDADEMAGRRIGRRHLARHEPAGEGKSREGRIARPWRAAPIHAGRRRIEGEASVRKAVRLYLFAENHRIKLT